MGFWREIFTELSKGNPVALMYVHSSEGSSPGRQGFKMFVSKSGMLHGSIGGGPMEHKLVELCKTKLKETSFSPFVQRQIHKSNIPSDKSGMICSGEQSIGFYLLTEDTSSHIRQLSSPAKGDLLILSNDGLKLEKNIEFETPISIKVNGNQWEVREQLLAAPELHIIGGGHVSEALSRLAIQLKFNVHIYETRKDLNTLPKSKNYSTTFIPDYSEIGNYLDSGLNKYVVLMSFGFRTDKVALTQLLDKEFKYIGMMGSKEKIKTLFKEMNSEGVTQSKLDTIHAPIGLQIASKTPMEIAISVMAEVIKVKNRS